MWKEDTIRYLGAIGGGSVNLTFFGFGDQDTSGDEGIDFNIKALGLVQQAKFRIARLPVFVGAKYVFATTDTTFDADTEGVLAGESDLAGLSALVEYDTRDTVFVFISLVVGMAVGSQRYLVAILGTVALLLAVWYMNFTGFGTLGRYDGYLTVRVSRAGLGRSESSDLLERFCRAIKPISTRQSGEEESAEFVYQVGLRDRDRSPELISALRGLDHVTHVSLVLRSELSEV